MLVEALGTLLSRAFQRGLMEGFYVGQGGTLVSHFQLQMITLSFCRNLCSQLRLLGCAIRCFEVVSRLKLNLSKNRIFGVAQVSNLRGLVEVLGC